MLGDFGITLTGPTGVRMPRSGERLLIGFLVVALLLEIFGVIMLTLSPPETEPSILDQSIAAAFLIALAIAFGAVIYLARFGQESAEGKEDTGRPD